MNQIVQNGQITPGHLAAWVTDGVIADAGVQFSNIYGLFSATAKQINFNLANTDNPIPIILPSGFTRYRIQHVILSAATAVLSTATCGLFTQPAGAGVAIITSGTAITVNQTGSDSINNMQVFAINNQNTQSFSDALLYFRVQTPQGVAGLGNVTAFYEPLP